MEKCCAICSEPLQLLHCRTGKGETCLECGQREFLRWLRAQPFELNPPVFWSPEKIERQLTKVYEEVKA